MNKEKKHTPIKMDQNIHREVTGNYLYELQKLGEGFYNSARVLHGNSCVHISQKLEMERIKLHGFLEHEDIHSNAWEELARALSLATSEDKRAAILETLDKLSEIRDFRARTYTAPISGQGDGLHSAYASMVYCGLIFDYQQSKVRLNETYSEDYKQALSDTFAAASGMVENNKKLFKRLYPDTPVIDI